MPTRWANEIFQETPREESHSPGGRLQAVPAENATPVILQLERASDSLGVLVKRDHWVPAQSF